MKLKISANEEGKDQDSDPMASDIHSRSVGRREFWERRYDDTELEERERKRRLEGRRNHMRRRSHGESGANAKSLKMKWKEEDKKEEKQRKEKERDGQQKYFKKSEANYGISKIWREIPKISKTWGTDPKICKRRGVESFLAPPPSHQQPPSVSWLRECSRACDREHMSPSNTLRGLQLAPTLLNQEPLDWVDLCALLWWSSNNLVWQGIGASLLRYKLNIGRIGLEGSV